MGHRMSDWHKRAAGAALIALLALANGGCERAKTRLDREVDRLCAIDGGVHIYETVTLPRENFGPDGEVFPQYRADVRSGGGLGPDFRWTSVTTKLVDGDPSLTRWEQTITRKQDDKVLGMRIVYTRGGGDLPGPWAASSYSCRDVPLDLVQKVFIPGDQK
jgi:hypothetical protein